jgi:hypothetical protein
MGFSEESFFKATYLKIYTLLEARTDYMKKTAGGGVNTDNENKALQNLDNFLG